MDVYNLLRLAFSLSMMPLRSIQVFVCINNLFSKKVIKIISSFWSSVVLHCVDVPQFIHLLVEGHLYYFQFGGIQKTVMNIHVHILCVDMFSISLG